MRSNAHAIEDWAGASGLDLFADGSWALFLDVDGTLVDVAPTPQAVSVDAQLLALIRDLQRASGGAVALISGRSMTDLDALFDPLRLPMAGMHGFERRSAQGVVTRPDIHRAKLDRLRNDLREFAHSLGRGLLEDKEYAFALHFRQAPDLESRIRDGMARISDAASPAFELIEGDCVVEIKAAAANKGAAIEAFMQEAPFAGRTPIFIGNDTTDMDGFAAIRRLNGIAIGVGERVTTDWHLDDPAAVRKWLERLRARD